jgi:hypothetical protein
MSHIGPAKEIPNHPTPLGLPVWTLEHLNGSRSYFYGDVLPQTPQERREREEEIARAIERILSECDAPEDDK